MAAETRSDLTFACRALDRLFRAGRYWIPQWYSTSHRLAYWDIFSHPANLPRYTGVSERTLWWHDTAKAAKPEQAK